MKCHQRSDNLYNYKSIQSIINESERRERMQFESQILNTILNVYRHYNIEIPLYLPTDLINQIDVNIIDDADMARIMLENILTML